jgi:TPR repeat protein
VNGYGVQKDRIEAYAYYSLAAPRDAEAQKNLNILDATFSPEAREKAIQRFKEKVKLFEEKEKAKAAREAFTKAEFSRCKSAAYKGNRGELLKLGSCYASGLGTSKDRIEAWACWHLAGQSDYSLGMMTYSGSAEEMQQRQKEFELVSKFASQYINDLEKGMSYDDRRRALDRSAVISGEIKSLIKQPTLSPVSAGEVKPVINQPTGLTADKIMAFKSLVAAAETGDSVAQCKVGLAYYNGDGVAEDVVEGAKWFRRAAEKGNVDAQWNLGMAYYGDKSKGMLSRRSLAEKLGIGIYDAARQAAKWWLLAAEQGHADSQYQYSALYYSELVTRRDFEDSPLFDAAERGKIFSLITKLNLKAASQGHVDAQHLMGNMYDHGTAFGIRMPEDAFVWFSLAAAAGDKWCKSKLDALELELDASAISRANLRIASTRKEIEASKAGK